MRKRLVALFSVFLLALPFGAALLAQGESYCGPALPGGIHREYFPDGSSVLRPGAKCENYIQARVAAAAEVVLPEADKTVFYLQEAMFNHLNWVPTYHHYFGYRRPRHPASNSLQIQSALNRLTPQGMAKGFIKAFQDPAKYSVRANLVGQQGRNGYGRLYLIANPSSTAFYEVPKGISHPQVFFIRLEVHPNQVRDDLRAGIPTKRLIAGVGTMLAGAILIATSNDNKFGGREIGGLVGIVVGASLLDYFKIIQDTRASFRFSATFENSLTSDVATFEGVTPEMAPLFKGETVLTFGSRDTLEWMDWDQAIGEAALQIREQFEAWVEGQIKTPTRNLIAEAQKDTEKSRREIEDQKRLRELNEENLRLQKELEQLKPEKEDPTPPQQ